LPAQFAPIKQIDMKSNMFRICAMLAGGLTGSVPPASATTHTWKAFGTSASLLQHGSGDQDRSPAAAYRLEDSE